MTDSPFDLQMPELAPPRTVLVTGGTGFVGANIVLHLAGHGYRVIAYDLLPPPPLLRHFWRAVESRIEFEAGSVTDPARLGEVGEQHRPAWIVHAAAVTAVDAAAEANLASQIIEVNLDGTVRLLELSRRLAVRRMVYISSAGVYGRTDPQVPILEDAPLMASGSLYITAKQASERICQRWAELFGLDLLIGRLGQPYGPLERDTGVRTVLSPIYQMARRGLAGGKVRVSLPDYGCDWTYTADLATAVRLLLEAEAPSHRVYNLSNGRQRKVSDVIAALGQLIPGAVFDWVGNDEPGDIDTRSDPRRGPLDISRLRRDVGFEPAYDLDQGLTAALPWWQRMALAGDGG